MTKLRIMKIVATTVGCIAAGLALGGFILPAMMSARDDILVSVGVLIGLTIVVTAGFLTFLRITEKKEGGK